MTLGEALKKARKQLGLNQSEMSSNVISTAFYSKVERGEYDLDTMKLIKILTIHQINPIKFFKQIVPLSFQRVANDFYSHDEIHEQILTAFTKQDLIKIEAIQKY
ncbi:helix-turn-helix domain-containing protein [Lactobacillus helveticus]|nr:helix-turn-helix transcriptional regulator [Lactobacillus helveticus]